MIKYDVDRKDQDSEIQVHDGYFVHYFAPDHLQPLPMHAIFILDTSGSMSGEKMEQMKQAMVTILGDMKENDYFNIITFSSEVLVWNSAPFVCSEGNKNKAKAFIKTLSAGGGTNINDAVIKGIHLGENLKRREELPANLKSIVIFLTDGQPSSGETRQDSIKMNIKTANKAPDLPIYSLGYGHDLDFKLLKGISQESQAFATHFFPT